MPLVLGVADLVKYKFDTKFDHDLAKKFFEMYHSKIPKQQAKIFRVNQITTVLFLVLAISFMGTCSEIKDFLDARVFVPDISFLVFTLIIGALTFYLFENDINQKLKKRRLSIQYEFPDFLNKLILLINAGMVVPRAWERIVCGSSKIPF